MIKVVIIGSGNVAKHLFEVFLKNDAIEIVQIVSRNKIALADFGSGFNSTTDFSKIEDADIYIIAVSDGAIPTVSKFLTAKNGLVAHTSGSQSITSLSNQKRPGVFYPLQTFSKAREIYFKIVPICLEAQHDSDLELLKKLAHEVSDRVYEISSEQREALHLAAVFVNNFTNHLCHIGNRICQDNQMPFEILKPLLHETIKKLDVLSPYEAQTGPARRDDKQTIRKHVELLEKSENKELYTLLSQSIQKTYGKEL